jgi:pimeloyl-ACP methyl ester carboxylesterase
VTVALRDISARVKHLALVTALALGCGAKQPAPAPPAPAFHPTAFAVHVSGHGRPVIFIPGLASPGDVWDGTVAHLGDKVEAHVLTLAGFAGQPAISGPFLSTVRDQIVEYIRANHLAHPIVVGHSLGGVLALWLAETDPDVAAVVDIDGMPFLGASMKADITPDEIAAQAKGAHDQIAAMTPAQLGPMMRQFLATMVTKPADLDHLADAAGRSDVGTVANAFSELLSTDLRPQLAKISMPVLVIAAGDAAFPHDKLEQLWRVQVDAIPHVELHVVDGAKHFVMLDQPDAFYALVDAFLAANAAR